MALNPYAHLHSKITRLLQAEAKLSADERKANQWQLRVAFCGTHVTVGKGDVNTIFFQFGEDGQRMVCFPDEILARLEKLRKQPAWRYELVTPKGSKQFWSLDALMKKVAPARGYKIYGLTGVGEPVRKLLHTAKQGLDAYEWR